MGLGTSEKSMSRFFKKQQEPEIERETILEAQEESKEKEEIKQEQEQEEVEIKEQDDVYIPEYVQKTQEKAQRDNPIEAIKDSMDRVIIAKNFDMRQKAQFLRDVLDLLLKENV